MTKAKGPNRQSLCESCGHRYKRAKDEAGGQEPGDAWRTSGRAPRTTQAMETTEATQQQAKSKQGEKFGNFDNCGNLLTGGKVRRGPGDMRICHNCGGRYDIAKVKAGEGQEPNDAWRTSGRVRRTTEPTGKSGQASQTPNEKSTGKSGEASQTPNGRCKTCSRKLDGDSDASEAQLLCEHCVRREQASAPARPSIKDLASTTVDSRSFARNRAIAFREWRAIRAVDLYLSDQPTPTGRNWWALSAKELREEMRRRGSSLTRGWIDAMISHLQADDAWNGYLPVHRPMSSELRTLPHSDLLRRVRDGGYRGDKHDSDTLIEFLESRRDSDDDIFQVPQDRENIWRSAINALAARYGHPPLNEGERGLRSWNDGSGGDARGMSRLHTTLADGLSPVWTSGEGLLCGARALATSLNALRQRRFGRTHQSVWDRPVTHHMLIELLFQNPDQAGQRDAVGIPTARFDAFMMDQWNAQGTDENTRGHEYIHMTRMNNFSVQQLEAMIILAWEARLIEENFSLGVVQGAHFTDATGFVPARPYIAYEGEGAGTVFVHHNVAASFEDYNHWEGFDVGTEHTDRNVVFQWGLNTPLSQDAPRPRFNARQQVRAPL